MLITAEGYPYGISAGPGTPMPTAPPAASRGRAPRRPADGPLVSLRGRLPGVPPGVAPLRERYGQICAIRQPLYTEASVKIRRRTLINSSSSSYSSASSSSSSSSLLLLIGNICASSFAIAPLLGPAECAKR